MSTGKASELQNHLDDLVHEIQINIESMDNAAFALKDNEHKYTWSPAIPLNKISSSFLNHTRYITKEKTTVKKYLDNGILYHDARNKFVIPEKNIEMSFNPGTTINLPTNTSFSANLDNFSPFDRLQINNISNGIYVTTSSIALTVSHSAPSSILFLDSGKEIGLAVPNNMNTVPVILPGVYMDTKYPYYTLGNGDLIYFYVNNASRVSALKLGPKAQITVSSLSKVTIPDNSAILVFKNGVLVEDQNKTIEINNAGEYKLRNPTNTNQIVKFSNGTLISFDNPANVTLVGHYARRIRRYISYPITIEREYLARFILQKYVDTLNIDPSNTDDQNWCKGAAKSSYFTGNSTLIQEIQGDIQGARDRVKGIYNTTDIDPEELVMYSLYTQKYFAYTIQKKCSAALLAASSGDTINASFTSILLASVLYSIIQFML